jgi:hypothetical protein
MCGLGSELNDYRKGLYGGSIALQVLEHDKGVGVRVDLLMD